MSAKKKLSSKALTTKKHNRRRLLTFWRVIRYGSDSFIRNSWLSVAATAVMTITLLIIFTALVTQNVLNNTIDEIQSKVNMSIYLKTDTKNSAITDLTTNLHKLSSVKSVTYISASQARTQFAKDNSSDNETLSAINEATNKFPATLQIEVVNINDTSQLKKFVNDNALFKQNQDPAHPPSFKGDRLKTIESIGRMVHFAQIVGLGAGILFVLISSLIIFNTIRMAIFNRREEIQMMKLIGADQSFIRGPFLVEAIIYGFIAAFIATGLGLWALYGSAKTLLSYQITAQPTIDWVTFYIPLVLIGMVGIGAVIGVISSLLATRRYLKL